AEGGRQVRFLPAEGGGEGGQEHGADIPARWLCLEPDVFVTAGAGPGLHGLRHLILRRFGGAVSECLRQPRRGSRSGPRPAERIATVRHDGRIKWITWSE